MDGKLNGKNMSKRTALKEESHTSKMGNQKEEKCKPADERANDAHIPSLIRQLFSQSLGLPFL
jgi:hypothetical protein